MTVDWEGLKALDAKTPESNYYLTIFEQQLRKNWPAILAQHEQDQKVIEEATKLRAIATLYRKNPLVAEAIAEFDKVKP